ncbi:BglII/BstYI family type II restriction endonuclease [Edaphobacter sp. 12200R-103]|jgi:hypothetical protein|uniref:BglII/BstYI family type II restriction endonuclease n=1 Tax=Edaphobacter sp. 12200R-103 TaxID=2703788 RepID=UPI00138D403C|nr:BglII/BstYI family type II restriction endonuclease [Edaphobacter sp. 12200R-103]QHS52858.1 restriction endonuclease [Edaphobacter sp. 12200R-103]
MGTSLIPEVIHRKFEIAERHHASSILYTDFSSEWDDLIEMLSGFSLPKSKIVAAGKNKSPISKGIDKFFYDRGWKEHTFDIKVIADDKETLTPTHHVDYFKNRVAVETEWNNKDPFFDRDLTTFRLLFELNVLSVGVIITRAAELQNIFNSLGKGSSYGKSTTHMGKLVPKIENRASGGCPVLAFGIKAEAYDPNN